METVEIWKPLTWIHPRYQVSSLGRVRSLDYRNTGEVKLLKPTTSKKGYAVVKMRNKRKQHSCFVHRLVALAFLENWMGYEQVNHKNFIKDDNRVDNLEWVTGEQNIAHAVLNGRGGANTGAPKAVKVKKERPPKKEKARKPRDPNANRGERNPRAKLTEAQVFIIKVTYDPRVMTQRKWAEYHGLKYKHFQKIINGELWKHV